MLEAKEILAELKKEQRKEMIAAEKLYEKRVAGICRLIHMGICQVDEVQEWTIRYGTFILVDRSMLPKVKKCLGRIHVVNKEVVFVDGVPDIHKVCIVVESPDYPGVRIRYHKELPEGSPCVVQKQVYPAWEGFTLVCKPKERE